jgi:hypothetical protein
MEGATRDASRHWGRSKSPNWGDVFFRSPSFDLVSTEEQEFGTLFGGFGQERPFTTFKEDCNVKEEMARLSSDGACRRQCGCLSVKGTTGLASHGARSITQPRPQYRDGRY